MTDSKEQIPQFILFCGLLFLLVVGFSAVRDVKDTTIIIKVGAGAIPYLKSMMNVVYGVFIGFFLIAYRKDNLAYLFQASFFIPLAYLTYFCFTYAGTDIVPQSNGLRVMATVTM